MLIEFKNEIDNKVNNIFREINIGINNIEKDLKQSNKDIEIIKNYEITKREILCINK